MLLTRLDIVEGSLLSGGPVRLEFLVDAFSIWSRSC
jgi:hypothetical protein